MRYLVWIAGLRGPEAQLWDEETKTADGKPVKILMGPIQVGDHIGLAQCQAEYPFLVNEAKP